MENIIQSIKSYFNSGIKERVKKKTLKRIYLVLTLLSKNIHFKILKTSVVYIFL